MFQTWFLTAVVRMLVRAGPAAAAAAAAAVSAAAVALAR